MTWLDGRAQPLQLCCCADLCMAACSPVVALPEMLKSCVGWRSAAGLAFCRAMVLGWARGLWGTGTEADAVSCCIKVPGSIVPAHASL